MMRGLLVLLMLSFAATASAATDPQKPTDVVMLLGTKDEDRVFVPNQQRFDAGKLYRLIVLNFTSEEHHFSAPGFAEAVNSRNLEIEGAAVTAAMADLTFKAGAKGEWLFVPVKAGRYPLTCTRPGHAKDGMTGMLTIE